MLNFSCHVHTIFQDMEKWAKSLNAQKEAMRDFKQAAANATRRAGDRESAAADAGFTILEKKVSCKLVAILWCGTVL